MRAQLSLSFAGCALALGLGCTTAHEDPGRLGEGIACESRSDCPSDQDCIGGTCAKTDGAGMADAGSGTADAGTRTGGLSCMSDEDCPPVSTCVGGACDCDAPPTCAHDYRLRCIPTHHLELNCDDCVCVPDEESAGCAADAECPPASSCIDGNCVCNPAPTCPDGTMLRCLPTHHEMLNCDDCECVATGGQWYDTCGEPVCREPSGGADGEPTDGALPPCTDEQRAGATCDAIDSRCDPDPASSCDGPRVCATENPIDEMFGCPISRRRFKRDIHYLTAAEREQAHAELLSIPLARYRYRWNDPRTHLGFIIEDVEPSAAVDAPRDMVDLYGYASMAVAALQVQNERIQKLEAELRALRTAEDP